MAFSLMSVLTRAGRKSFDGSAVWASMGPDFWEAEVFPFVLIGMAIAWP